MRISTVAVAVAWAVVLVGIAALPLGGWNRDRPDAIQVIAVGWRPDHPISVLSLQRGHDPASLAIRIPRHQLVNEIVLRSGPVHFTISACARAGKTGRMWCG